MKKEYIYLFIGLSLLCSCAREKVANENETAKEVLEAWLGINHPGVTASGCGIYILEDVQGSGAAIGENSYVVVDYTTTDLSGTVSETTSELIARRVDLYKPTSYYGPVVQYTGSTSLPAGVEDMLKGMKVGGRRKALIPGWLITSSRYSDPAKYLAENSDEEERIYDVTILDYTSDITKYQIDNVEAKSKELYAKADSLSWGFYYHRTGAPDNEKELPSDTTVYVNYTGKLLNGKVFDTSIEEVAKDAGIHSKSKTYGPATVKWAAAEDDLQVTFAGSSSSSSVIKGFELTLRQMHAHEKGVGMFISNHGYGDSGKTPTIPAFAPLIFEIQMVDKK